MMNNSIIEFENKYNVAIVSKTIRNKKLYRIHGHSSTESPSKQEAIIKYLAK